MKFGTHCSIYKRKGQTSIRFDGYVFKSIEWRNLRACSIQTAANHSWGLFTSVILYIAIVILVYAKTHVSLCSKIYTYDLLQFVLDTLVSSNTHSKISITRHKIASVHGPLGRLNDRLATYSLIFPLFIDFFALSFLFLPFYNKWWRNHNHFYAL